MLLSEQNKKLKATLLITNRENQLYKKRNAELENRIKVITLWNPVEKTPNIEGDGEVFLIASYPEGIESIYIEKGKWYDYLNAKLKDFDPLWSKQSWPCRPLWIKQDVFLKLLGLEIESF